MNLVVRRAGLILGLGVVCVGGGLARGEEPGLRKVDFVRDVQPILARYCYECHGPDAEHRKGDLRLDTAEGALGMRDGGAAIVAKHPEQSEALIRIQSTDDTERMPPPSTGKRLDAAHIDLLQRWIHEGAEWKSHWSFTPLRQPDLPTVQQPDWCRTPIDHFVLAKLEQHRLQPSPAADPYHLARRVALDLTGLPPAPEWVEEFVASPTDAAYERFVDRLLGSPAYGERWARIWLDLARYADTRGYEKDRSRTMWRYRDWLIDALNADLPFDQFTRDQIAGDLLPNPTTDQLLATAMHRNTMVNEEGGTDDEEFRIAAVKDRVDTTLQVWMGLTAGCAKCHSHKYDPLSQKEYYQLLAFFNQTADSDRGDEFPTAPTPTREQSARLTQLQSELDQLQHRLHTPTPELEPEFQHWVADRRQFPGWKILKPESLQAASGSEMHILPEDQSVLVRGPGPAQETYTLIMPFDGTGMTALRLETIPHASLPRGGVGRSHNDGNFVLTGLKAVIETASGEKLEVPLQRAEADFSQENYPVSSVLQNPNPRKQGWAVSPQLTRPHTAIFFVAPTFQYADAVKLTVVLDHQFEYNFPGFSIGRFRLAVTNAANPTLENELPPAISAIIALPTSDWTAEQKATLYRHFAQSAPTLQPLRDQIAATQQQLAASKPVETPIMRELPADKLRTTTVHVRGNFLEKGETVTAAVPAAFHSFPADAPRNRLGLAQWLIDPANPLTARVAVNRQWAQFFGQGLVESQEDFGIQGLLPSHPELLDWLAADFRLQGWSMKQLCRTIVLSATYRQSSRVTPALLEQDRYNRLLARGPRFRLEAETLRDQALAISGLLSRKMYGPSVMPPQPDGIWRSTYNVDKWKTSDGEDRYRRGLYTFIKRTSPYPSLITFDGPSREICTIRRINTNTPLQALVLLNDPVYIEASQALAQRIAEASGDIHQKLAYGLQRALVRPAQVREVDALLQLYEQRLEFYVAHPEEAANMLPAGVEPASPQARAELAALTAVCNVILNLDELVTRG